MFKEGNEVVRDYIGAILDQTIVNAIFRCHRKYHTKWKIYFRGLM